MYGTKYQQIILIEKKKCIKTITSALNQSVSYCRSSRFFECLFSIGERLARFIKRRTSEIRVACERVRRCARVRAVEAIGQSPECGT